MKPLPYEIPLPDGELLENGTMFVRLPTLSSLELFWEKNKSRFSYAVQGSLLEGADPFFNDNDEWIFGDSKASVIETLIRWGDSIIDFDFIEFEEWIPAAYLNDRDVFRKQEIEKGRWTDDDEQKYRADCKIRTPETYKGCWDFKDTDKFPGRDLFPMGMPEELIDPTMPREKVAEILFPWLFDESVENGGTYFYAHDSDSVDRTIRYEQEERATDSPGSDLLDLSDLVYLAIENGGSCGLDLKWPYSLVVEIKDGIQFYSLEHIETGKTNELTASEAVRFTKGADPCSSLH